jgi:hypothetical protein
LQQSVMSKKLRFIWPGQRLYSLYFLRIIFIVSLCRYLPVPIMLFCCLFLELFKFAGPKGFITKRSFIFSLYFFSGESAAVNTKASSAIFNLKVIN